MLFRSAKYVRRLPKWTKIDLSGEEVAPPDASHTVVHEVMYDSDGNESMSLMSRSNVCFNPAVLQRNETGSLVRLQRGTRDWERYGPYVRTRHVGSYGFDLTMTDAEFRQERADLLHWVAKNAPRQRNRTMSHNLVSSFLEPPAGADEESPVDNNNNNNNNYGALGRHVRSNTFHT